MSEAKKPEENALRNEGGRALIDVIKYAVYAAIITAVLGGTVLQVVAAI